jgi:hypothetical protein
MIQKGINCSVDGKAGQVQFHPLSPKRFITCNASYLEENRRKMPHEVSSQIFTPFSILKDPSSIVNVEAVTQHVLLKRTI